MKTKHNYNSTEILKDLNVLIRFLKLKNLKTRKFSKFCVEFRNQSDNFRFTYDFHREKTELEHFNTNLYGDKMRRLYITNKTCDFLFLLKDYDHRAYK